MLHFATHDLTHLLNTYGYWAVLLFVAIESTGIPFPGETMLLVAAVYAGTTHHLAIPFVITAAAVGAILGDNLGFWVGREGGYRLLRRYGHVIRLDERKLKLGQYLFQKHGGKVVFFGRFVAVLRAWAAFLAGTNRMPCRVSWSSTPPAASCGRPSTDWAATPWATTSTALRGRWGSPSWSWPLRSSSPSSSICAATRNGWRRRPSARCRARSTPTNREGHAHEQVEDNTIRTTSTVMAEHRCTA